MADYNPQKQDYEKNPYFVLVSQLWQKAKDGRSSENFNEELELITRKLANAIQEDDAKNYELFNDSVAHFFSEIRKNRLKDHLSDITLLQSSFYELYRLDTLIRTIRAEKQLPGHLETFFNLPRRKKLREVFLYVAKKEKCGLSQISKNTKITRQHARNLCIQLQEYHLINIAGRDGKGQTAPLLYGITNIGKRLKNLLNPKGEKSAAEIKKHIAKFNMRKILNQKKDASREFEEQRALLVNCDPEMAMKYLSSN